MKILVVDDNPSNLEILQTLLRATRVPVLTASSGQAAFELACRERPDLVLMDLAMPGEWDGLEATRRIKACAETSHAVVIALTAMVTRDDQAQAFAAGCSEFLRKPYTRRELLAVIGRFFPTVSPEIRPSTH
ncbi:MAG TPA: response regulator [Oscillatoriaceae cyanobacterium]